MNSLSKMYTKFKEDVKEDVKKESIGITGEASFNHIIDASVSAKDFVDSEMNQTLKERKELENLYHQSILLDLFHNLDEMKFYSNVEVSKSRRMITTNNDCLSMLHLIIRDEIYINAYFRSSDLYGALPIDLEFLVNIPAKFIRFLDQRKDLWHYHDITPEYISKLTNMKINFKVMFGSLHTDHGY